MEVSEDIIEEKKIAVTTAEPPKSDAQNEEVSLEKNVTPSRDIEKVGSRDVKKPTRFKDWNTPWIRRDGSGLKKIFRNANGIFPVSAPVRTSHNHFYSEPHSFLGPEPEPIPLERIEEMREAIAKSHGLERRQEHHKEEVLNGVHFEKEENQVERRGGGVEEARHGEKPIPETTAIRDETNATPVHAESEACEGSEPPELEEILEENNQAQSGSSNRAVCSDSQNSNKFLYDVQEEEIARESTIEDTKAEGEPLPSTLDLETLKKSMEKFTNMSGYEPTADELIQVLKNLENLAASNAPMYMALVQLIEANQSKTFNDNMNLMNGEEILAATSSMSQRYEEASYEERNNVHEEDNGVEEMNGTHESVREEEPAKPEEEEQREVHSTEVVEENHQESEETTQNDMMMKKEDIKKVEEKDIMERIAAKKQEVRRRVHAEPRKIKVVAGSQHRASWPCAPNVTNTTCPKVIEVVLGETEEDSLRNRRDVAERAGLKHIDVIVGDDSFYPQLFDDFEYPWKGSLRPVSDSMQRHGNKDLDIDSVPWASSLRHVPDSQRRKKPSKTNSTTAPWIGTLRHVKASNNPPKTFTKPQFKRYPDEDAPNPFQSLSGKDARPAYPLTPAASIHASSLDENEAFDNPNEDVDRIRNNLRETRAISNTLLRVLMPKLLKEHESKYEPLSFEESQRIMQEVLSQKIGIGENESLNDEDLNKEIDEALLGKVEDDLKAALSTKKKDGKSKKKKKKVTSASSSKKLDEAIISSTQ